MPEKLIAQVTDNGFGTLITGVVAGLAGFGWQLWRTRRADHKADASDHFGNEILSLLRAMADESTKRADGFAKERNYFATQVGRLEAKLEGKDAQVGDLLKQVSDRDELIRGMGKLIHHLLRQCPGRVPSGVDPKIITALIMSQPEDDIETAKEPS